MGDTKKTQSEQDANEIARLRLMIRAADRPYGQESLYLFATPKMEVQEFEMPNLPWREGESIHSFLASSEMIPTPARTSEVEPGILEASVIEPTRVEPTEDHNEIVVLIYRPLDRGSKDSIQVFIDLEQAHDNAAN